MIDLEARVDRGQDFRPRKIQLVKTETEDNQGFFFLPRPRPRSANFDRGQGRGILAEKLLRKRALFIRKSALYLIRLYCVLYCVHTLLSLVRVRSGHAQAGSE